MEILKKHLLKFSDNMSTEEPSENIENNLFFSFLDAMFCVISKYDSQILNICETVRCICMYRNIYYKKIIIFFFVTHAPKVTFFM